MNPSWPAVLCATTNWPIHQNSLSVTSVIKICQAGSCVENMCYGALGELANFVLLACIQDQGFDRTYRSDEIQNTKASRTIGHTVRWENNFEIGEAVENGMGTALAALFCALWSFSSSYSNWYQRLLSNKVSKTYLVLVLLHITQSHDESVHTLPIMYIVVSSFFVKILMVVLVVPLPKIQSQSRAAPLPQEWDWEERRDNNIVVYIRNVMIFDLLSPSYPSHLEKQWIWQVALRAYFSRFDRSRGLKNEGWRFDFIHNPFIHGSNQKTDYKALLSNSSGRKWRDNQEKCPHTHFLFSFPIQISCSDSVF